ncbi:hypothetical protein BUALT_Bualt10G0136500 [Buddleja alternifolia]|uniref:Alpha/beta hydrolase fold-3 domain-containing protein n=1 Tax=Buddleja alternifolia TaxID=168488 RepID=A0AAV6X341_9LAMI|nr:hypothetical protein BUALT_Bualt10G0136500 [Buddleja alternifolia]
MSIVAEALFIQVFSNGTVKRFAPETAPASPEYSHNSNLYRSKDVIIDPIKPITARIFLPDVSEPAGQLPVLVYFHGGGFCIGSTTWLGYHVFLGDLSATAKAIVLSVDYRLAPENKLPIAYEDCYTALEWLSSNAASSEPWLKQADLSRVFLSGDSAGGNIAHQLSLPDGSDRDFHGCNFEENETEMEWSVFPAVLVFVAGKDFLKERGVMYSEFLKRKGVKGVSLVEADGESHVYHVWNPESEATRLLQKQITGFIRGL